ncbi:MAG TPA: hypothetical protein VEK57_09340 [Thermoanaerobaculia bacterium]|nr:hypothetical protein [Thermoanaerobaculia bacterium]
MSLLSTIRRWIIASVVCLATANAEAQQPPADLIVTNANVHTT